MEAYSHHLQHGSEARCPTSLCNSKVGQSIHERKTLYSTNTGRRTIHDFRSSHYGTSQDSIARRMEEWKTEPNSTLE
jgi:hypothetical protein